MSDKVFNLEIIDAAGRTIRVRGVPSEGVKNAKETLRKQAVKEEYEPPFYYVTHQMGGRNGKRR